MDSYVAYNLWGFLASVLLLSVFIFSGVRLWRKPAKNASPLIVAFLTRLSFVVFLDFITRGWTSYSQINAFETPLTPEKYHLILLVIEGFIGVLFIVYAYGWLKQKRKATPNG